MVVASAYSSGHPAVAAEAEGGASVPCW